MGERLLCKQEVIGSIPFTSTTDRTMLRIVRVKAAAAVRLHRESTGFCDSKIPGRARRALARRKRRYGAR